MLEIFEESIRSFVLKKVPNHKVETQNQLHPLVRVWGSGSLFVIDSRSSPRSERIAEDADDLPAKKETFVFFLPLSFWGQLLPIQAFYIEGFSTEKKHVNRQPNRTVWCSLQKPWKLSRLFFLKKKRTFPFFSFFLFFFSQSNKQRKGRKHFEDNANKMLASLFGILSTKPNQNIN